MTPDRVFGKTMWERCEGKQRDNSSKSRAAGTLLKALFCIDATQYCPKPATVAVGAVAMLSPLIPSHALLCSCLAQLAVMVSLAWDS